MAEKDIVAQLEMSIAGIDADLADRSYQPSRSRLTACRDNMAEALTRLRARAPEGWDELDGLRPCPFCGGEAEELELEDAPNAGGSVICCKQCGASSPVHFDRKEHLVSSWNERASSSLTTTSDDGPGSLNDPQMMVYNDPPSRAMLAASPEPSSEGRGEPVAWLHTMTYETGQTTARVTLTPDNPFGEPGRDYSREFPVVTEPLVRAAPLSPPAQGA